MRFIFFGIITTIILCIHFAIFGNSDFMPHSLWEFFAEIVEVILMVSIYNSIFRN